MKLSAPPPPPEPNEPEQPTATETPAAEAPGQPAAAAPPTQKALAWPAWFAGADFLLVLLVLALAFLASSFVARNSDLWLHLATGQRLLAGEYRPGSDPFSFSAPDRTWVNHSILYDVGVYLLYSGNGMLLVVLKALAVVAAVGLVISLRRPGFALWPWATLGLVAVFAIAPYLNLRPFVGSLLLFALTLFLLFRGNFRPGSWQFPAAIGATFWVWANVDEWFFLGPLAVALVLAGELIQRVTGAAAGADAVADEPLGSPPDVPALAKALGVGLVACVLNPHHIGVWQLPLEVTGARELLTDPRFRQLFLTPLEPMYREYRELGYNLNGLAYAVLFVAGGASLGLAGARLRLSHLLLWVGFALLSLQTIYLIPFVALLAVPLVAARLNALSSGVTLKTWGDPKSRLLLLGSGLGRVMVLAVAAVSCVAAWPGWVHPYTSNEAFARRVGWAVEPDEGMVRGAEQLRAWRSGDAPRLAPEAHGLILSLEFANYCAWYAPQEKVYANGRFRHHHREYGPFTEVRKGLELLDVPADRRLKPEELNDLLAKLGTEYVVIHVGPADASSARSRAVNASIRQWLRPTQWSPWYLDGRTTISGWRTGPGSERPSFAAIALDPVRQAFGPDAEKLPRGKVASLPTLGGWEASFLRSPRTPPPDGDVAVGWQTYKQAKSQFAVQVRDRAWDRLHVLGNALAGGWPSVVAERAAEVNVIVAANGYLPPLPSDEAYAAPLLALRAAHRAIAADPDHPDGYLALASALGDRDLPLDETMRTISRITALRQCLQRLPSPENYRPGGGILASPLQVSIELVGLYLGRRREGIPISHITFQLLNQPRGSGFFRAATVVYDDGKGRSGRQWVGSLPGMVPGNVPLYLFPLDEIRETLQRAKSYLLVEPLRDPKAAEELLKNIDGEIKAVEDDLGRMNNRYEQRKFAAGGQMPLAAQVEAALEYNLVGEAIRLMRDEKVDPEKEFGQAMPQAILSRIALELAVGRLEEAAADLDALAADPGWEKVLADDGMRHTFLMLKHHKCVMEGDYAEAGTIIERLEGEFAGRDPRRAERERFDPKPFVESKYSLADWAQLASPLTVVGAPTPLDVVSRLFAPAVTLSGFGGKPGFSELQNSLGAMRQAEGSFYLRRGMLSLFEGDIKAARERFLQTRPTPAQIAEDKKWGLPPRRYAEAERYLQLIEKAASARQK